MRSGSDETIRYCALAVPAGAGFLLLLLLALAPPASASGTGAYPPPLLGDWVVGIDTTVTDEVFSVQGNVTVNARLTLDNSTMRMNVSRDGQYHIEVRAGGEMRVTGGSTVRAFSPTFRYEWWTRQGAKLTLQDSAVRDCGWGPGEYDITGMRSEGLRAGQSSGLLVQADVVTIERTTFTDNYYSIIVDGARPAIRNNLFGRNRAGGVVVMRGGAPEITGNEFSNITGTTYVQWGLIIHNNSSPAVRNNRFLYNTAGTTYGMITSVYINRSAPVFERNYLFENDFAVIIDQSTVTVSDTQILSTERRALWASGSNVTARNLTISLARTLSGEGVYAERGSNVTIANSSITGGQLHFDLRWDGDSGRATYVWSLNTTFDPAPERKEIHDTYSRLYIFWYLSVNVTWYSGGAVPGASVTVANRTGTNVSTAVTGADGWTQRVLLQQEEYGANFQLAHTPHNVTAMKSGLRGVANVTLNGTRTVSIRMDNVPPRLAILSPVPGAYLNTSAAAVSGLAYDNETGVILVELSVDGVSWRRADGTAFWNGTLNASDGTVTLRARATDFALNTNTTTVTVTVDTLPPAIEVTYPPGDGMLNLRNITLTGRTEGGLNLTLQLNNTAMAVNYDNSTGSFSAALPLPEGASIVELTAVDAAGNTGRFRLNLTVDSTVSPFIVSPGDGALVNTTNITLTGFLEAGATLAIGGRPIDVANGTFNYTILLAEGPNTIELVAADRANNTVVLRITITLDMTPPLLNLTEPAGNTTYTNRNRMPVSGFVEAGAVLTINGYLVTPDAGGYYYANVSLLSGVNRMEVVARDRAGNTARITHTFIRDLSPPTIELYSPPNGYTTTKDFVWVKGSTREGNITITVTAGRYSAKANSSAIGGFSVKVKLDRGNSIVRVVAQDRAGNAATQERAVTRKEAPPPPSVLDLYGKYLYPLIGFLVVFGVLMYIVWWGTNENPLRWTGRKIRYYGTYRLPYHMKPPARRSGPPMSEEEYFGALSAQEVEAQPEGGEQATGEADAAPVAEGEAAPVEGAQPEAPPGGMPAQEGAQ